MKIVARDNFNRDDVSDILVAENVPEYYINVLVDALNARFCPTGYESYHYSAADDDYRLYVFEGY